ncbi:MFS transporter [Nonomuraea sp. NPDC050790]|uniref:MFS transporter n=1 Tax=Nonomuraea sp. NPDC050790 TaxID=3364371 RepID=UPI0037AD32E1
MTDIRLVQRRTLVVLLFSQVIGTVVMGVLSPVLPLLAEDMTGSQTLAGLSQALITSGALAFTIVLAALAVRHGRRAGIATGSLLSGVGVLLIVPGQRLDSFALVLLGCLLAGGGIAAGLQARFAATDLAERPGQALGLLQWASLAGGVAGPLLIPLADRIIPGLPPMTGMFVVTAALLALGALIVALGLRPDPLSLVAAPERVPLRSAVRTVLSIPAARRGLVAMVTVHAVMIALMNMAGIHLHHHGATLQVIGVVISFHVAAMFLPGPLVGLLADRLGPGRLLVAGLLLQAAAAVVLQSGDGPVVVGTGLVLLGAGWSAGFLAGSIVLTTAIPVPRRPMAQGASDFLMQLTAAAGALAAGTVVSWIGYAGLARGAGVVVLAVLAGPYLTRLLRRRGGRGGDGARQSEDSLTQR